MSFPVDSYVMHPSHGVARVRGVERIEAGGIVLEALAIEPIASSSGVVRIPMDKVAQAGLTPLTAAEAISHATGWTAAPVDLVAIAAARARGAKRQRQIRVAQRRMLR